MRSFFFAILIFVCGCASVGITKVKEAPPKPKDCALDVYTTEAEIKKPFEVLCMLDSKTATNAFADKSIAGAVKNATPQACECGADGILISDGHSEGMSLTGWGQGFAVIKAIRYKK